MTASLCLAISTTGLAGWVFDAPSLRTVLADSAEMKINTALCLMFCSVALWLNAIPAGGAWRRVLPWLGLLPMLVGVATLTEYLFAWDLGVDQLLARDSAGAYNVFRGRMSPVTSVTLSALGAGLAVLPLRRLRGAAEWTGICGVTVGLICVLGYAWGVSEIVSDRWLPPVAVNTAACFVLLGTGMLMIPASASADHTTRLNPVESKILVGFAAAMLLLLGVGTYTYKTSVQLTESLALAAHAQEVRASLATLYGSVAGSEVALRDYVRDGASVHGADYRRVVAEVRAQLGDVRRLTADNPAQRSDYVALSALVAGRLETLAAADRAYTDFGRDAARAVMALGRDTNASRDVGELTDRMSAAAQRELQERRAASAQVRTTTLVSLLATLVVAAILFTALFRAIHREMRGRHAVESALRTSDQYNRSIVDSSPDCLCVLSLEGRLKHMSPQGLRLMEVNAFSTIEDMDWMKAWTGADRDAAAAAFAAACSGRQGRFQGYRPTLTGQPKWWDVILMPVLGADARPERLLAVARDISDVKRVETELLEANRFLDSLIENLPLMVAVKDASTLKYVRLNRAAEGLLGLPRQALLGKTVQDLMEPAAAAIAVAHDREALQSGRLLEIPEYAIQTEPHGTRILHVMKMPLADDAGKPQHLLDISVDITERKLAEQAIHELNSALHAKAEQLITTNRELESFSYSVSHDLRAPLRAIDGFAQMLAEDHAEHLDAEARRYLDVIRNNGRRMGELIDDLLAFSRLGRQPVDAQEVDVESLVREVVQEALTVPRHPVPRVDIGRLPAARGDRALLRQVWTNLISNALKYSSKHAAPRIEVTGERREAENQYSVSDNGVGFDMEYADKLFGVFQRLHHAGDFDGTGVGLAIVHRVVTRHGGRVWARGKVDEGAVFSFTLPEMTHDG